MVPTVLLNLSTSSIAAGRKIYRTKSNTPKIYYLLTTITNNTILTFFDNISDSSLGAIYNSSIKDRILSSTTNVPTTTVTFIYPFSLSTIVTTVINTLDVGYYDYAISYYNSVSLDESTISDSIKIVCANNQFVNITISQIINTSFYDSYKIYRTKIQNSTSTDTNLYLLTTISKSYVNFKDVRYNNNPSINYIPPLQLTTTTTSTPNTLSGIYNYIMTFLTTNTESLPTLLKLQVTYPASININLDISSNSAVIQRKIYRTKANIPDVYYLLTTISDNTTPTFYDNISDSSLTQLYNNTYNNDNILGAIVNYNYLNITTPINNNLINKPTNFNITEIKDQNSINGGTYKYLFTYCTSEIYEFTPYSELPMFDESVISNITSITVSNNSNIRINLYKINDLFINIYRTNVNSDIFLLLKQIDTSTTLTYTDNLTPLVYYPLNYNYILQYISNPFVYRFTYNPLTYISQSITKPDINTISYKTIDKDFISQCGYLISSNNQILYKYKFSYYNTTTCEESVLSDAFNVISYYSIYQFSQIDIQLYIDLFFNVIRHMI